MPTTAGDADRGADYCWGCRQGCRLLQAGCADRGADCGRGDPTDGRNKAWGADGVASSAVAGAAGVGAVPVLTLGLMKM